MTFHSSKFALRMDELLGSVPRTDLGLVSASEDRSIIVVGGGKSAQEYVGWDHSVTYVH